MHKNSFVVNFALFGCPQGKREWSGGEGGKGATLSLPHVVAVKVFSLRCGVVRGGGGAAAKNYAYAQLNPQQIPFLFVDICCCLFMCVCVCHKIWMRRVRHTNAAYFLAHMNMQQQTAAAMRTKPAAAYAFAVYLFIPVFIYLFIYSFVVLLYSRALRILCNVASSIVHGMPTLTSDL